MWMTTPPLLANNMHEDTDMCPHLFSIVSAQLVGKWPPELVGKAIHVDGFLGLVVLKDRF